MSKPKIVEDFISYTLKFLNCTDHSEILDLIEYEVGSYIHNLLIDIHEEMEETE